MRTLSIQEEFASLIKFNRTELDEKKDIFKSHLEV